MPFDYAVILKADEQIGTGHLMRINNLLPALRALHPGKVRFTLVTDSLSPSLQKQAGRFWRIVRCPYERLAKTALEEHPDAVIIDHYFVDQRQEAALYDKIFTAVIDDLANRPHLCHLLLDQGLLRQERDYQDLVPRQCRLCIGAPYALTSHKFFKVKQKSCISPKPKVLISLGGSDPHGVTLDVLKNIGKANLTEAYEFLCIAGAANARAKKIEALCQELRIRYLHSVPTLFPYWQEYELSVGAYGGMFLERIAAAVPSVCIRAADNQEGAEQILKKYQAGCDLSARALQDPTSLKEALAKLSSNFGFYAENCRNVLDGGGTVRAAKAVIEGALQFGQ